MRAHLGGLMPGSLHDAHDKGRVRKCVKYGGERRRKKSRQTPMRFKSGASRLRRDARVRVTLTRTSLSLRRGLSWT